MSESNDPVEGFRRMLKLLEVTPEQLRELASELGIPTDVTEEAVTRMTPQRVMKRPDTPKTMLGLNCALDPDDMIVIGDIRSETGFNAQGNMTLMVSTPTRPLGGVQLTREQVVQLRDFLNKKLGE